MTTALLCLLLLLTTPLWILSVLGEVEKYWGDPVSISVSHDLFIAANQIPGDM